MPIFTTRVNFNDTNQGANGRHRVGGLTADAAGNLSGATALGGANGDGTVFDIPSMDGSYAGTPATLDGTDGAYPDAGLIAAAGDFSGTTIGTSTSMDTDAVAATAAGSTRTAAAPAAPTLTTLVSFNYTDRAERLHIYSSMALGNPPQPDISRSIGSVSPKFDNSIRDFSLKLILR
jgi:hypothetical protein